MAENETPSAMPSLTPRTPRERQLAGLMPPWKKGQPHPRGGRPKGTDLHALMVRIGKKHLRNLLPLDAAKQPELAVWDKKADEALIESLFKAAIADRDMAAVKMILERRLGPVPLRVEGANGEPLQFNATQNIHLLITKVPVLTLANGVQVQTADVIEAIGMAQATLNLPQQKALPAPQPEEQKNA